MSDIHQVSVLAGLLTDWLRAVRTESKAISGSPGVWIGVPPTGSLGLVPLLDCD